MNDVADAPAIIGHHHNYPHEVWISGRIAVHWIEPSADQIRWMAYSSVSPFPCKQEFKKVNWKLEGF